MQIKKIWDAREVKRKKAEEIKMKEIMRTKAKLEQENLIKVE